MNEQNEGAENDSGLAVYGFPTPTWIIRSCRTHHRVSQQMTRVSLGSDAAGYSRSPSHRQPAMQQPTLSMAHANGGWHHNPPTLTYQTPQGPQGPQGPSYRYVGIQNGCNWANRSEPSQPGAIYNPPGAVYGSNTNGGPVQFNAGERRSAFRM